MTAAQETVPTRSPFVEILRSSRPVRIVFVVAVGVIVLVSALLLQPDFKKPYTTANDMSPDYISAKAWFDGQEPYAPIPGLKDRYLGHSAIYFSDSPPDQRNAHPPIVIVLFAPFALLSIGAVRILWLVLMALLIVVSIVRFTRELGWSQRAQIVAGSLTLIVPAVRYDLLFAQMNGLLLFLLVEAWIYLRRGRDRSAGIVLGVFTAIKIFPILLIVPLIRMRRFRAAAWTIASAAFISLVGVAGLGLHSTKLFLLTASPANTKYWISQPGNISLVGLPFRWLTKNHWSPLSVDSPAFAYGLALIAFGLCIVGMYRTPARLSRDKLMASIPWLMLAAPLSWYHYAVLLIPLLILLERNTRGIGGRRLVVLIGCAGALSARLVADLLVRAGIDPGSTLAQVLGYSVPMYGLVVLCLAEWARGQIRSLGVERRPSPARA